MANILRGESLGCSNPKLDLYVSEGPGGPLRDVEILEFAVFDMTDPSPIQVYPATGRQALDPLTDCPAGHRISVGRYVAEWDVPASAAIATHRIQWWFRLTSLTPETSSCEDFEVSDLTGGSAYDPASVASFKILFPAFTSEPPDRVQMALDAATRRVPQNCLGHRYSDAHGLLTAHILVMTSEERGSGVTSVSAGPASVGYQMGGVAAFDRAAGNLLSTGYGAEYADLIKLCGPGMRVLCGTTVPAVLCCS